MPPVVPPAIQDRMPPAVVPFWQLEEFTVWPDPRCRPCIAQGRDFYAGVGGVACLPAGTGPTSGTYSKWVATPDIAACGPEVPSTTTRRPPTTRAPFPPTPPPTTPPSTPPPTPPSTTPPSTSPPTPPTTSPPPLTSPSPPPPPLSSLSVWAYICLGLFVLICICLVLAYCRGLFSRIFRRLRQRWSLLFRRRDEDQDILLWEFPRERTPIIGFGETGSRPVLPVPLPRFPEFFGPYQEDWDNGTPEEEEDEDEPPVVLDEPVLFLANPALEQEDPVAPPPLRRSGRVCRAPERYRP